MRNLSLFMLCCAIVPNTRVVDPTSPGLRWGGTPGDFLRIAESFGMASERVVEPGQIDAAIRRGLEAQSPYFIEVRTALAAALPPPSEQGTKPLTGD